MKDATDQERLTPRQAAKMRRAEFARLKVATRVTANQTIATLRALFEVRETLPLIDELTGDNARWLIENAGAIGAWLAKYGRRTGLLTAARLRTSRRR
jgi:hypothetical protein